MLSHPKDAVATRRDATPAMKQCPSKQFEANHMTHTHAHSVVHYINVFVPFFSYYYTYKYHFLILFLTILICPYSHIKIFLVLNSFILKASVELSNLSVLQVNFTVYLILIVTSAMSRWNYAQNLKTKEKYHFSRGSSYFNNSFLFSNSKEKK